jgi:hypothetical protein
MGRPEPGQRLITQNLLATASQYERQEQVSWSTIRHLSMLVDTACLYNRIWVIGRHAYSFYTDQGSDLLNALRSFISVNEFSDRGTCREVPRRSRRSVTL